MNNLDEIPFPNETSIEEAIDALDHTELCELNIDFVLKQQKWRQYEVVYTEDELWAATRYEPEEGLRELLRLILNDAPPEEVPGLMVEIILKHLESNSPTIITAH